MSNLTAYLLLSVGFLILFFIGELLLKFFKVSSEISRKFAHITSGLLACAFPFAFDSHWWVMAICASFLALLYLSAKFNFLKSINSVERKTYGSVLYPIAIYICFFLNQLLTNDSGQFQFYFTSVLILALSDPLAAIIGGNYPIFRFKKIATGKSLSIFFIFSAVSGSGNTLYAFFIEAITIALYISAAYLMGIVFKQKLPLVWSVETMYFIVLGLLSYTYFIKFKWRNIEI